MQIDAPHEQFMLEALNEAKKDFLALLDNGEYFANEIAAEEIKRDYEYIEKDKSRHKYLSFKPNA